LKKLIVCLAAVAVVAGSIVCSRAIHGQEGAAKRPQLPPHHVGLIDMAQVFKEYTKFKTLSEGLKAEVEQSDGEAKAIVEELKQIQAKIQSGTYKQGSPEYGALEAQGLAKQSELETLRKVKQREFLRKEADIYKTVYLEVQDVVKQYAVYYGYTLIIRFNRDNVEEAGDPQSIINSMNRQVVYHSGKDDLTDPILDELNRRYAKSAGGAVRPAGATGTRPQGR
jgi:outer membrane protein